MNELMNNKMAWLAAFLVGANLLFYFGWTILVDKAADRVIQKLEKEYSPSPYGPGLDPDKVDPGSLRNELHANVWEDLERSITEQEAWRSSWEKERVNP